MQIGDNWNEWTVAEFLGEGSFGQVYKIVREEFGQTYESALKVIRIPQSRSEVDSMRSEGMTKDSVTEYYRSVVEDIVSEFALMSRLRGNSNIVSYEDHKVVELEDEFGWEIYIRMELLTPLLTYLKDHELTREDVVRLGIDMCKALETCQKNNIIHRDVKPENIFYSAQGSFKLGDFGIARQFEKTSSGMSKKGTYSYMAPEVYKGLAYNETVDIYSLGIVMYRFLNNNRGPFLPDFPKPIRYSDKEESTQKRMRGDTMPKPCNADERLSQIVLTACAYDPKERFHSAEAMRYALENETQPIDRGAIQDQLYENTDYTAIVADSYPDAADTVIDRGFRNESSEEKAKEPTEPVQKSQGFNRKLIPILAACLVIIAFAAGFLLTKGSSGEPEEAEPDQDLPKASAETLLPEDSLNEIKVLSSDWDWSNSISKKASGDGLNHVDGILLVDNDSDSAISSVKFSVKSEEGGTTIMNDADGSDEFTAEGYVPSGERGIMVADIAKKKYSRKNQVDPQVSSYQIEEAALSDYIADDYKVPSGRAYLQHGDSYDVKISNKNDFPVNAGAKAVLVLYNDSKNVIVEAVATGELETSIGEDERVIAENVFYDPGLHYFYGASIEDYKAYILDLDYYHYGY